MKYVIRNSQTGEEKTIDASEASDYGIYAADPLGQPDREERTTPQKQSLGEKIKAGSKAFLPGLTKWMSGVGGSLGLKTEDVEESRQSQKRAQEAARNLTKRAQEESDPKKKEQLLKASRSISENLEGYDPEATAMKAMDLDKKDIEGGAAKYALKTGGAATADTASILSSFMSPIGPKGGGFLPTVARGGISGAIGGGTAGMARGLSDNDINTIESTLGGSIIGGGMSAATTALFWSLGELTQWVAKTAREKGLLPKVDSSRISQEVAEYSLNAQDIMVDGKKVKAADLPKNYQDYRKYMTKVYKAADKQLKAQTKGTSFGLDEIVGSDKRAQTNFINALEAMADDYSSFVSSDKLVRADDVAQATKTLKDKFSPYYKITGVENKKLSANDWITLKSAGDDLASVVQEGLTKKGGDVASKGVGKTTIYADSANQIRNSLREYLDEGAQELMKTQYYSNLIKATANAADKKVRLSRLPQWHQLSALTAGIGGVAGYMAGGGAGALTAGALGYLAPWAGYQFLQSPRIQNWLYQKGGEAMTRTAPPVNQMLRNFLSGQAGGYIGKQ